MLRRARTVDRATGLTAERLSLLSVLSFVGPQTVGDLAAIEMVSRPAISRIVNALEESGLVRRERSGSDRREVLVKATRKGRRLMETARRRRLELIGKQLGQLDEKELDILDAAAALLESLQADR